MADETKEENKQQNDGGNIGKTFADVAFSNVEDKYTVTVQYDVNSEMLSLKLINQTTKHVFKHDFVKENVHKIMSECKLKPHLIVKMIIDTLKSKELTEKNVRIFLLPNIKQATAKYNECRSIHGVPDAINIPTGFQPKLNSNINENNQLENYLLFVLHFSAPPYLYFNYCFIIKEKEISDNDKLGMRFNDLQKENVSLKNIVDTQQTQINELLASMNELSNSLQTQQHQIAQLTQQLETKEEKIEEIALNLQNNWVRHNNSYEEAKAFKIGKVVYLKGMVSKGTLRDIATLPKGWRPVARKIFSQTMSGGDGKRVDILSTGRIYQYSGEMGVWTSLDGISFVIQ